VQGGWHLRHDPDAAVVVTEILQLYVSVCGAVDTAVVAYLTAFGAGDTAFWSLARWTQPLEPALWPLPCHLSSKVR